jgi:hypothetical protein
MELDGLVLIVPLEVTVLLNMVVLNVDPQVTVEAHKEDMVVMEVVRMEATVVVLKEATVVLKEATVLHKEATVVLKEATVLHKEATAVQEATVLLKEATALQDMVAHKAVTVVVQGTVVQGMGKAILANNRDTIPKGSKALNNFD